MRLSNDIRVQDDHSGSISGSHWEWNRATHSDPRDPRSDDSPCRSLRNVVGISRIQSDSGNSNMARSQLRSQLPLSGLLSQHQPLQSLPRQMLFPRMPSCCRCQKQSLPGLPARWCCKRSSRFLLAGPRACWSASSKQEILRVGRQQNRQQPLAFIRSGRNRCTGTAKPRLARGFRLAPPKASGQGNPKPRLRP